MTLGWILEDAWDAYLEAQPTAEPPPPEPARIRCPFCTASFSLARELTAHLGDQHRGERPILLIRGLEPAQLQQFRIGTSLRRTDVALRNCSEVHVSINATPATPIQPSELPKLLADQDNALVDIRLTNQFDAVAQPTSASYRLLVNIPEKRSLDAVDRAFKRHLATEALDFNAIDRFLSDRACIGLANTYASSLADYVRGVLVKDRPIHLEVTTSFSRYRDLYNTALLGLQPYSRPLPALICAVIRFALNNFSMPSVTGFTPLDGAAGTLTQSVRERGEPPVRRPPDQDVPDQPEPTARAEICPLDDGVSRVLALWARLRERRRWTKTLEDECRHAAMATTLDAPDREKVLALWALAALRMSADASEPLSRLASVFPFANWASEEREKRPA